MGVGTEFNLHHLQEQYSLLNYWAIFFFQSSQMNFEQKASIQSRTAMAEGDREDHGCFEGF